MAAMLTRISALDIAPGSEFIICVDIVVLLSLSCFTRPSHRAKVCKGTESNVHQKHLFKIYTIATTSSQLDRESVPNLLAIEVKSHRNRQHRKCDETD
jgi:hypothetical protein